MLSRNRCLYLYCKLSKKGFFNLPVGVISLLLGHHLNSIQESFQCIKHKHPDSGGSSLGNNYIRPTADLHIIVPVYDGEKTIKRCLTSILNQKTKYKFVVDVINDGSTDDTQSIISKFRNPALNIISEENRGLSGARNTGLRKIKGKYILFVDADDVLRKGAVQNLLDNAYKFNADIVEGGYRIIKKGKVVKTFSHLDNSDANPFKELYGYPRGKLYKASLFKNVIFPEGYRYEDTVAMYRIWPYSNKTVTINNINYDYEKNENGITSVSRGNIKSIDTLWITIKLLSECEKSVLSRTLYDFTLKQIIMNAKRLNFLSNKVNKANFVISSQLINIYFNKFRTTDPKLISVENALRKKDYITFILSAYIY